MIRRLLLYTLLLSFFQQNASAACLPEWKYNRSITVSNSNASVYSDFQVKIILNTQALIAAGKMQVNGADIRFTDANCNNLHYWIDSNINTTTTVIWVKVKSIAASGNSSITMYYGNQCCNPAQNGDSTFVLFDDFSGSSINTAKWNTYQQTPANASINVAGGLATFNGIGAGSDNIIRSVNAFASPIRIEAKVIANSGDFPSMALLNSGTFNGVALFSGTGIFGNFFHTFAVAGGCNSYSSGSNSSAIARANGVWGLNWPATNAADAYFPGGTQAIAATPALAGSQHAAIGMMCLSIGSVSYDWARLRKYAPVELSTAVNAENNQGAVKVSFTPQVICPGSPIRVTFSKNGIYFNPGNSFTVQLSDATGSFSTAYNLGTIVDTIPDTIFADIPKLSGASNLYKIRVVSSNPSFNCFVSDSSLTILPRPTASYLVNNDNQCYKWNNYSFTSTSTIPSGTIDTAIWHWDDASGIDTFLSNSANHSFSPFYAYYYPKLTVISNLGCRDSTSVQVNIQESPDVKTVFNDTIQCFKGNFFIIQSQTKLVSGSMDSIIWDLGDGSAPLYNIDSFSHLYNAAGIYQIRQINQHSNGCRDTGFLACLVNTHPVAIINTNDTDQCRDGNYFIFEAQSTITNGLPLLNYWSIGDGLTYDMQDSVHHSYPSASNRTVQLITISDDGDDGCADTTTQVVLVNPMPDAVINNLDVEKCFNYNNFRFIAKSTIAYGTLSHSWDFGDLSTISNQDTVAHSYAASGSYSIKMNVASNKGCLDSAFTLVDVRPSPIPSFTINKDTQCFKYHQFKAYSTSTINSGSFNEIWQISDGGSYTDVDSIQHAFNAFGNYNIRLILTSNYNCKDTINDSVYVLPMPTSSFTVNDVDQCLEGNSFTYTDNSLFSQGTLVSNKWLFDDGGTAVNMNSVNHSYLAENDYKPALIVYADNGCFDTSFQAVKVYPHPGTDFFINKVGQCVNDNNYIFTNNTFISEGGFVNRWFFGDGSAFVEAFSASKKYTKDSTYNVRVISYSDQGCTDTATKQVVVYPKSITNFTIDKDQQCILGNQFTYTSTTTLKSGTYTLAWQYGDGVLAGNVNPTQHSYTGIQPYTVKLISTTNFGCLDTIAKTVRTLPMPVANFNFNYSDKCLLGNDFQFNASSTVSNGTPMNHNWYFGDNDSTINSTFAQHTYLADGSYTVRLISSTNIGGCKDSIDKVFNVFPMPVASFTIDNDRQCFKGNRFGFNSTSTVSSGTIDVTQWAFGDNTTSAVPNPFKSYSKVDSFRVSLVVSTNQGCVDSIADRVYVFPMPVADFTVAPPYKCLKNNLFTITNKSSIVKGVISDYRFYYGNGDSAIMQNPPPYSYSTSGAYTIVLNTITDKGCTDSTSKAVTVNPNPEIDFDVDPVCLKDSSYFINNTTIAPGSSITAWKWIFGNGRISTLESPAHKYKDVGNYDITLIATTDKNCIDTLMKPGLAVVNPNPKAGFIYQKIRSWENEVDIQYTDTSIGALSWNWNFSSMGTSTEQHPKLFYIDTLTQITRLVVSNNFGCRDTVTKVLFIAPDVVYYMPTAFTPNDDNYNETFKPIGLSYAINYKFIIFNRWGEILFRTDNPQIGWDGKYGGEYVAQDLYFYRLEFVGVDELRHEEKGNIMVLR